MTRMAPKHRLKKGAKIYAQRKAIVEPVNRQITEARGLRRFLRRGLEKVNGEWHLIAATHNLLKLFRFRRSQQRVREMNLAIHEREPELCANYNFQGQRGLLLCHTLIYK
jgi:hypothetical protein